MHDNTNAKILNLFNGATNNQLPASEIVINSIKNALVKSELNPGDRLPSETELAEAIGVSRGSVREAMKILRAYGIVDIRRGDGTYITDTLPGSTLDPLLFKLIISRSNFNDLREFREMIELGMIKLVLENADENDIKAMEESYLYAKRLMDEGMYENESIIKAETMFHSAFGKATKNKLVQIIYQYVMDLYIPKTYKDKNDGDFDTEALSTHRLIIDAIIQRNEESGRKAINHAIDVWKEQARRYNKG